MTTKTEARKLQGSFTPEGRMLSEDEVKRLQFRLTKENEVLRCVCSTGIDPQSGPLFCGDVADYVAVTDGGHVALCEHHMKKVNASLRR